MSSLDGGSPFELIQPDDDREHELPYLLKHDIFLPHEHTQAADFSALAITLKNAPIGRPVHEHAIPASADHATSSEPQDAEALHSRNPAAFESQALQTYTNVPDSPASHSTSSLGQVPGFLSAGIPNILSSVSSMPRENGNTRGALLDLDSFEHTKDPAYTRSSTAASNSSFSGPGFRVSILASGMASPLAPMASIC